MCSVHFFNSMVFNHQVMCSNINRFKSTVRGKDNLTLLDCEGGDGCNNDSGYVDDSFSCPNTDDAYMPSKVKSFSEDDEGKSKSFIGHKLQNDIKSDNMVKAHVPNHIATTSTVFKNIKYECMDGGSRKRKISSDGGNNKTENLDKSLFNSCKDEIKMEITNDENNKDFLNVSSFTQNKNLHSNNKSSFRVSKKYSAVNHRKLTKSLMNGKVCSYDDETVCNKKSPIPHKNPYLEILEKNCSLHLFNLRFILKGEGKIFLNDVDTDQGLNPYSKSEVCGNFFEDNDKIASRGSDCVDEGECLMEGKTSLLDDHSDEIKLSDSTMGRKVNSLDVCTSLNGFDKVQESSHTVSLSDIKPYIEQSDSDTKKENINFFKNVNNDVGSDSFTGTDQKTKKELEENKSLIYISNDQKVSLKGINLDVAKSVTELDYSANSFNASMNSSNESGNVNNLVKETKIVPNLNESATVISQNNSLKLTLHSSKIKSIKNLLQMNR